MDQGIERNAHIIILDADGATVFNGRRTVRDIKNDGEVKTGVVTVYKREYDVIHRDWKWFGPMYAI